MKHTKKLIALLLAVVTVFSMLALVGCTPEDIETETVDADNGQTKTALALEPVNSQFITLSATPMLLSSKSGVLQQTLTATVLPATAENKAVDWSVAWSDSSNKTTVTDYVTVTPKTDGSTTATVSCYQPFTGNIVITVTTRDGGYTARCICKYVGKPTSLVIEPTGASVVSDNDWNVSVAEVGSNKTYYFDLIPSNAFGSASTSFTPDYTISMTAHGSIDTYQKNYDSSGSLTGTLSGTVDLAVADLMESNGYCYAYFPKTGGLHTFVTLRISGGKLMVEAKDDPASFAWTTGSRAGSATCTFNDYTDDKLPYVAVTVTEKNTGISQTIYIRTVSAVNSVSLNVSEVTF